MAKLGKIREGLAANLSTITGLQVSPVMLATPSPPCAHIFPAETEYDLANARGLDRHYLTVQVLVPFTTDVGAQVSLDAYLAGSGPTSFKEAIENDRQLADACDDLRVVSASGYRLITYAEGIPPALGCEWRVEVIAQGDS